MASSRRVRPRRLGQRARPRDLLHVLQRSPVRQKSTTGGWFPCVGRRRRTCGPGPRSTAPAPEPVSEFGRHGRRDVDAGGETGVRPPDPSGDRLGRDGCSGAETPDSPSSRDTKSCHHGADSRLPPDGWRAAGAAVDRRALVGTQTALDSSAFRPTGLSCPAAVGRERPAAHRAGRGPRPAAGKPGNTGVAGARRRSCPPSAQSRENRLTTRRSPRVWRTLVSSWNRQRLDAAAGGVRTPALVRFWRGWLAAPAAYRCCRGTWFLLR